MKFINHIIRITFLIITLLAVSRISYSQSDLNRYARDYIKSSLIINYYSEGRTLFEESDLGWKNIYPNPGYKYVIEIKPYTNSYLEDLEGIKLYEYNFEFIYTSNPKNWNSKLGRAGLKVEDFREVYSIHTNFPIAIEEINLLHQKGLIAETTNGEIFIVNRDKNYYEGISTVSKSAFEVISISEVILLRYFHYLPKKIQINIENSSFSFYSNTLERYFSGKLKYLLLKRSYGFELEDGVLIGD